MVFDIFPENHKTFKMTGKMQISFVKKDIVIFE